VILKKEVRNIFSQLNRVIFTREIAKKGLRPSRRPWNLKEEPQE